jgi:hypothetical protein
MFVILRFRYASLHSTQNDKHPVILRERAESLNAFYRFAVVVVFAVIARGSL